jgi:hypothetical protein
MEIEKFASFQIDVNIQIERARVEELEWALVNDGKKVVTDVRVEIFPCLPYILTMEVAG